MRFNSNVFVISLNWTVRDQYFQALYGSLSNRESLQMGPMLSRPKSRGRVTLRSKNPFVNPIIDPNFLDHPDDTKTIIEGKLINKKVIIKRLHMNPYILYTKYGINVNCNMQNIDNVILIQASLKEILINEKTYSVIDYN